MAKAKEIGSGKSDPICYNGVARFYSPTCGEESHPHPFGGSDFVPMHRDEIGAQGRPNLLPQGGRDLFLWERAGVRAIAGDCDCSAVKPWDTTAILCEADTR